MYLIVWNSLDVNGERAEATELPLLPQAETSKISGWVEGGRSVPDRPDNGGLGELHQL